jgi:hypothetical protein
MQDSVFSLEHIRLRPPVGIPFVRLDVLLLVVALCCCVDEDYYLLLTLAEPCRLYGPDPIPASAFLSPIESGVRKGKRKRAPASKQAGGLLSRPALQNQDELPLLLPTNFPVTKGK